MIYAFGVKVAHVDAGQIIVSHGQLHAKRTVPSPKADVILDVGEYEFTRIEFGRIGRQENQASRNAIQNQAEHVGNLRRIVDGRVIRDENVTSTQHLQYKAHQ